MSTPAKVLNEKKKDLVRPIMSMTKRDLKKIEGAGRLILISSARFGQAGDLMSDLLESRRIHSTLHKIEGSEVYAVLPRTYLSIEDIKYLREKFPFISRYE